jgi:hypothetical protein
MRVLARGRDISRRYPILPFEVSATEGVDKVVDDLCALDSPGDVVGGTGVALNPTDALLRRVRGARNGDELVVGHEEREERASDHSGRAEDRDLHALVLEASSSK